MPIWRGTTMTNWTLTFSTGDIFAFNVDSAATLRRATLTLRVTKN